MSIPIVRRALPRIVLIASALAIVDGCSKASDDNAAAAPNPTWQAQATQSSIAAAQAAQDHRALGMARDDAAMASTGVGAPNGNNPPMSMGTPTDGAPAAATGMARMLGQPPMPADANAAGSLPAAIGAPHIYHLGAAAFFVDQARAIGLTSEQQAKLTALRENASMAYASTQRKIDRGEQDLWALSSSEAPDITKIDANFAEFGRLTVQQRMEFVRAVGAAVAVLTDAQRKAVVALGAATMPSAGASAPMKMTTAAPAPGMPMGGGSMEMGGSDGGMAMGAPADGGRRGMQGEHGRRPMGRMPKGPMAPMGGGMPDAGSSGEMGPK